MADNDSDPASGHRRRPRYRGTHPRTFEEKHKERSPEAFPELIEHVRERGRTPAGQHVPILVDEALAVLAPGPGQRGVDGTLGFGGHAERFLERLTPGGCLLALDVDPIELPRTEARLRERGYDEDALIVRRSSFAGLTAALHACDWGDGADFVFVDLGVSSMQLDDPARGFTYKADGPLDMRMNPGRGLSAAQWLARSSYDKLVKTLQEHSDEPHAERIAEALGAHKLSANGALQTTLALAEAVRDALSGAVTEDDCQRSVRRVFQALRIAVNDEFGALDALLRQLPGCLRPGGRAALLSFHSGEDRRVKQSFRQGLREGTFAAVADDVVRASAAEKRGNPRASSAKLRWARKA